MTICNDGHTVAFLKKNVIDFSYFILDFAEDEKEHDSMKLQCLKRMMCRFGATSDDINDRYGP